MRASLAGDARAYRALLGDLAPLVRGAVARTLARMGQGNAEAEDVVQEVLLAIHLKRQSWDPARPLAPWLHAVIRHKLVDMLRRRGRHEGVPIDAFAEVIAAPEREDGMAQDAERMLDTLDERQRRLVRGLTMEGRSAAEMGRELGMSEGAARVALHRALRRLADRFQERAL